MIMALWLGDARCIVAPCFIAHSRHVYYLLFNVGNRKPSTYNTIKFLEEKLPICEYLVSVCITRHIEHIYWLRLWLCLAIIKAVLTIELLSECLSQRYFTSGHLTRPTKARI